MENLFYKPTLSVDKAYIITLLDNETSANYSKRCQDSCDLVGMPYEVWPAYDGTGPDLKVPAALAEDSFMRMVRVTNHGLTKSEVACALSHVSLWAQCVIKNQPIVVLEHDAVMIQKYSSKNSLNSVCYLGGAEWANNIFPIKELPPLSQDGPNYFICRAHAYAIDPLSAKTLLAHVLNLGIYAAADMMIKADLVNICHEGFFAYDKNVKNAPLHTVSQDTTIVGRGKDDRGYFRKTSHYDSETNSFKS